MDPGAEIVTAGLPNSRLGVPLRDFVAYNARAQGHLNSDGLCFVQPNGPLAY